MIRRARPDESTAISALAYRSKAYWGYDLAFMDAHRDGLRVTPDYIEAHPTYVFEERGAPLAFYALAAVDRAWVELDYLFVEPRAMGQGIGRRLLCHAGALAAAQGYRYMRIVSDPNAAGFYRQMGAEPWGEWHSPIIPGRRLPVLSLGCTDLALEA